MAIQIPPISEEQLQWIQEEVLAEDSVLLSDLRAQSMINRIRQLEGAVRGLLSSVVPHARDTGHNAADREMQEAIQSARAAVPE